MMGRSPLANMLNIEAGFGGELRLDGSVKQRVAMGFQVIWFTVLCLSDHGTPTFPSFACHDEATADGKGRHVGLGRR